MQQCNISCRCSGVAFWHISFKRLTSSGYTPKSTSDFCLVRISSPPFYCYLRLPPKCATKKIVPNDPNIIPNVNAIKLSIIYITSFPVKPLSALITIIIRFIQIFLSAYRTCSSDTVISTRKIPDNFSIFRLHRNLFFHCLNSYFPYLGCTFTTISRAIIT